CAGSARSRCRRTRMHGARTFRSRSRLPRFLRPCRLARNLPGYLPLAENSRRCADVFDSALGTMRGADALFDSGQVMNCAVDCDGEVISMWPLGVIAGVISVGAVARLLVGRDKVPPMERRNRALALLRDLAEQPRTIPDLVPPPEARTDHVRILEEAPAVGRNPRRASAQRPAAR